MGFGLDGIRAEKKAACLASRMVSHLGWLMADQKAGCLGHRMGFCLDGMMAQEKAGCLAQWKALH